VLDLMCTNVMGTSSSRKIPHRTMQCSKTRSLWRITQEVSSRVHAPWRRVYIGGTAGAFAIVASGGILADCCCH
jgi:hypothetical protein